jgi:hypothetical protein
MYSVRSAVVCALALAAALVGAGQANAAVQVTKMVATPVAKGSSCSTKSAPTPSTQAGARADICVAMAFNGGGDPELGNIPGLGDDPKTIEIKLAPGLGGPPAVVPRCSVSRFNNNRCPSNTQVGELSAAIEGLLPLDEALLAGKVFNLELQGTEGARLGLQVDVKLPGLPGLGVMHLQNEVRIDPVTGAFVNTVFDAPRDFLGIPIEMRRLSLKLWGSKLEHPSMPASFGYNPTDCSRPAVSKARIVSHGGDTTQAQDSFTPTGCDKVGFSGDASVTVDGRRDAATPLTATVTVPARPDGPVNSHIREAKLVLPEGFELSPTAASDGKLEGCSDAAFDRYSSGPAKCPANSQIGEIEFSSPLLIDGPVKGPVFMGDPVPGKEIRFFGVAQRGTEEDAIRVKVEAVASIDPQTGQITTRLADLPPLPFDYFAFSFRGGKNAIVASPRSCGTFNGGVDLDLFAGRVAPTSYSVGIDKECDDPGRFRPSIGVTATPTQAGADTTLITTMSRPDGDARIASALVRLPPGLAGRLGAAEQCPLSAAATGDCSEDTRVGTVGATAGPGDEPLQLGGKVYLTEGQGSDPAGLTITVDAKFGPLDLGKVVVPGRLLVRDEDQGLNLAVEDIPQRVQGISSSIRDLEVRLDKPGFSLNATSCAPQQVTASLSSDRGGSAEVAAPYQATGCENLPFTPKLEATLLGGAKEAGENGHPGVTTVLTQTPGEANNKKVSLLMPLGISVDSTRINRACPIAQFQAGTCGSQSVLGSASAQTPLLRTGLSGPVTMVQVPGSPLPELRIELRGVLPVTLPGKITIGQGNRLNVQVEGVPDVPIQRFELSFSGGDASVLQTSRNLCADSQVTWDNTFESHAGSTSTSKTTMEIPGCGPTATLRVSSLRSGRPSMDLRVVGARNRLRVVRLTVPKGMEFQRSSIVRKRLRISASGLKRGSRASVTVTGRTIRVSVPSRQSAKVLRVRLAKGGVRVSKRLRSRSGRLSFTLDAANLGSPNTRSTLRVRPSSR